MQRDYLRLANLIPKHSMRVKPEILGPRLGRKAARRPRRVVNPNTRHRCRHNLLELRHGTDPYMVRHHISDLVFWKVTAHRQEELTPGEEATVGDPTHPNVFSTGLKRNRKVTRGSDAFHQGANFPIQFA